MVDLLLMPYGFLSQDRFESPPLRCQKFALNHRPCPRFESNMSIYDWADIDNWPHCRGKTCMAENWSSYYSSHHVHALVDMGEYQWTRGGTLYHGLVPVLHIMPYAHVQTDPPYAAHVWEYVLYSLNVYFCTVRV